MIIRKNLKKLIFVLFICLTMMLNGYSQDKKLQERDSLMDSCWNKIIGCYNTGKSEIFCIKEGRLYLYEECGIFNRGITMPVDYGKLQALRAYCDYIKQGSQNGTYTIEGKTFFIIETKN